MFFFTAWKVEVLIEWQMYYSEIIWQYCSCVYKWTTDKNKLPAVQIQNLKWRAQSRIIKKEMIFLYFIVLWIMFAGLCT